MSEGKDVPSVRVDLQGVRRRLDVFGLLVMGLAAATGVGLGAHLIGQIATGRVFKGGPSEQTSGDAKSAADKPKGGDAS